MSHSFLIFQEPASTTLPACCDGGSPENLRFRAPETLFALSVRLSTVLVLLIHRCAQFFGCRIQLRYKMDAAYHGEGELDGESAWFSVLAHCFCTRLITCCRDHTYWSSSSDDLAETIPSDPALVTILLLQRLCAIAGLRCVGSDGLWSILHDTLALHICTSGMQ